MSEGDVVKYYNDLKDKKGGARLIAELNAVREKEIVSILESRGVAVRRRARRGRDWSDAEALWESGATDREIGERLNIPSNAVRRWRERNRLYAN